MSKTLHTLALLFIPFFIFLLWMPISSLDIANISPFLRGDLGQYIIGEHIMRNSALNFPIFFSKLAHYPAECPVIYTTIGFFSFFTIPLSKLFNAFLPQHIQILGWQFLAAVYGLFLSAYIIFKKFELPAWPATAAAILVTLFPPFFSRFGHGIMTWHFVILLGIALLFFTQKHTLIKSILLNVFSFCVYTYFLPVTLGLTALKPAYDNDGHITLKVVCNSFIVILSSVAGVAITAYILGYFGTAGALPDNAGFGFFSMNVNSMFNPMGMSRLMPALPVGTAGQGEGFQYFGLGLLFFVGVTFLFSRAKIFSKKRTLILFLFCTVFTLIALSNTVYLGSTEVFSYELGPFKVIASAIRSSGRLFWPVAYILIIIACVKAYKGLSRITFIALVTFCIALQLFDVNFRAPLQSTTAQQGGYDENLNKFISGLSEKPAFLELNFWNEAGDSTKNYQAILTAVDHKIPVTRLYTSRGTRAKDYKPFATVGDSLAHGGIVVLNTPVLTLGNSVDDVQYCAVGDYVVAIPANFKSKNFPCTKTAAANIELDEILSRFAQNSIIISASDDAAANLRQHKKFVQSMKNIGSNIENLQFRQSYIAVIYNGNIIFEKMSNDSITFQQTVNGNDLKVTSSGLLAGDAKSEFSFNGKKMTSSLRGLNFLISEQNNLFLANYDTCAPPTASLFSKEIYFPTADLNSLLKSAKGLSHAEPWGRWSDANIAPTVQLDFKNNLPRQFILRLKLQPFGPNTDQPLRIRIGEQEKTITPKSGMHEYPIPFTLTSPASRIEIFPPHPTTPQSMGENDDARGLGIGFERLSVEESKHKP